MTDIIFDIKALAQQKRRKRPHPLIKQANERLRERLTDLKENCPHKISCFELQTSNDLAGDLRQIYEDLPQGGIFLGVIAGGETLHELKICLTNADKEVSAETLPRIAPMIHLEQLSKTLSQAGFAHTAGDTERFNLIYSDMISLMHDLRGTGFANSLMTRPRRFSKRSVFDKAHKLYEELFPAPAPTKDGITATVDLLYMHGWKEHSHST